MKTFYRWTRQATPKIKKTIKESEQINHERRKYSCPTNTEKIFNLTSEKKVLQY